MPPRPPALRIDPAPDAVDPDLEPLLSESFAQAYVAGQNEPPTSHKPLRDRLLGRLAISKAASAVMVTVRQRQCVDERVGPGAVVRALYQATPGIAQRPGEPLQARLVELQPGAHWTGPGPSVHREWLVLRGSACIGRTALSVRDYHRVPSGHAAEPIHSDSGALLFLRESRAQERCPGSVVTVHDAEAAWPEFAPGIRRRVLWQQDGQAALLYHAAPGALVPSHVHGHDEECLMVEGELFLDDILLQVGDYQLARAGTGHRVTETDTGVIIYAHGDLDLKFVG